MLLYMAVPMPEESITAAAKAMEEVIDLLLGLGDGDGGVATGWS